MKDHQILRFESPKKNDWYRRRSWLPDEPSLLALYDVTPDTVDTWSDDSDEDDLSDIRYDGMSDDSITASHGSSPETSDFSDEDVSYEETARRRKESDQRRKERSSATKPKDRRAGHRAPSDKLKPSTPTNSALRSSEKTDSTKAKPERAASNKWCNPRLLQMLTEEWDMDPRSQMTEATIGKGSEHPIPAKSSSRSSQVSRSDTTQSWRSPKGKAPAPTNNNLPPSKRWNPPKPKNSRTPKRPPTPRNSSNNAPKRPNSSSSNRDFPPRSSWAPPSSNNIGLGISTSITPPSIPTATSTLPHPQHQDRSSDSSKLPSSNPTPSTTASRLRKQQHPKSQSSSSPESQAQQNLNASIRLFAKEQARVSVQAVKATQMSLTKTPKSAQGI